MSLNFTSSRADSFRLPTYTVTDPFVFLIYTVGMSVYIIARRALRKTVCILMCYPDTAVR